MKKVKSFINLFLPLVLGTIVAFLTRNNIDYEYLIQPVLAPPAIVFPIVWTIIYFLLGLSFYHYKKYGTDNSTLNTVYYLQLFFNLLWPIIFFNLKFRFIGTIWIIILDLLVMYLMKLYFTNNRISTYLNIPYLIWILFATYLTFSIYLLN